MGPSFMKIWTCGSSLRSGYWNAWTRIINVNGARSLSNFWNFLGANEMVSCRDWWPWTKPHYINLYDLDTNQQSMEWWHSGSPRQKKFWVQKSAGKFLASIFWGQDGILHIDYLPKGQTINVEYFSSLLVQLKDILRKNAAGRSPRGSCSCTTMPQLTCNPEETDIPRLLVSWLPTLFSRSCPVGLPPVP